MRPLVDMCVCAGNRDLQHVVSSPDLNKVIRKTTGIKMEAIKHEFRVTKLSLF